MQTYWLLSFATSVKHFCCLATLNVLLNGDDSKLFRPQNFLNKHRMSHYQVGAWLKSSLALLRHLSLLLVFVVSFLTFRGAFFGWPFVINSTLLFLISCAPPPSQLPEVFQLLLLISLFSFCASAVLTFQADLHPLISYDTRGVSLHHYVTKGHIFVVW